jgi:hypothetical protein
VLPKVVRHGRGESGYEVEDGRRRPGSLNGRPWRLRERKLSKLNVRKLLKLELVVSRQRRKPFGNYSRREISNPRREAQL